MRAELKEITELLYKGAKHNLESGCDQLMPLALVGKFGGTSAMIGLPDLGTGQEAKEKSVAAVKLAALRMNADYVCFVMESWALKSEKKGQSLDELRDGHQSLSTHPKSIDIVLFSVETRQGTWMGSSEIKKNGCRTIKPPEFIKVDKLEGLFTNLLPKE